MSIEFLVTSLIVIVIPGTGVVYTVASGLSAGRAVSIAAAVGCTLGITPHIVATALGLAAVMHASALAFNLIKYCGVAYLLYLAWQALKEDGTLLQAGSSGETPRGLFATIVTGFLINILNPKLSIFFLAFLPQFITPATDAGVALQIVMLGGVFMVMTFAVFAVYGVFAAFAGAQLLRSARVMRWMRRTIAVTFAGFGLRLAMSGR